MDKDELKNGYFEGSLSESQSAELERLRNTDVDFASDFEFERELQSALRKEERQEIKGMFAKLNSGEVDNAGQATVSETGTKVISIRPWLVAASIVFLLGLGSWLLFFNSPNLNTEQLYTANFTPYENVVHPIERGEKMEDLQTRAFTAYEDADYTLALELFKELQVQQSDPYIAFYEAIVRMQLDQHRKAVPLLEDYIANGGQLKDRATWYLALAYLKQDDIVKSKRQLQKLVDKNEFKAEASRELLKVLK